MADEEQNVKENVVADEEPNVKENVVADEEPNVKETVAAEEKPEEDKAAGTSNKEHLSAEKKVEENKAAATSNKKDLSAKEKVEDNKAAGEPKDDINEEASEFAVGDIVELHSLSLESLNGSIGKVHSQKGERFVIVLPPPEKEEVNLDPWEYKSIKPKNLRKLEDQENEKKLFTAKEDEWNSGWTKRQTEEAYRRSLENKMWQSQKGGWFSTAKRYLPLFIMGILGIVIPKYNLLANVPYLNRFAKPAKTESSQETAATLDDDFQETADTFDDDFADEEFFQDDEAEADEDDTIEVS